MVLLLSEADDPDAKLLPPTGPPVTRVTVEDGEGNDSDTDDEETVRLVQDPPPSYTDVQSFRIRAKSQEEEESAGRARRRFWLAVGIALFLCSLPSILVISLTRSHTLEDITTPEVQSLLINFGYCLVRSSHELTFQFNPPANDYRYNRSTPTYISTTRSSRMARRSRKTKGEGSMGGESMASTWRWRSWRTRRRSWSRRPP
jgi:hypothetical protein